MEINEELLNVVLISPDQHKVNKYKFEREYIDRVNLELGSLISDQGYKILKGTEVN